jgi:DNA-binding transcriptional regulator LsrR (DeoR family)
MQHPKRIKHMAQRRDQGLTHKELGQEFGISRQHVGRLLAATLSPEKNIIKDPSQMEFDGVA